MIAKQVHPVWAIAPPTVLSKPVLHPRHEEIEREVVTYLVNTWEWPSERHRKGFISWKLSEVINFMFPTGDFERVKLACELLLLGFLMDGTTTNTKPNNHSRRRGGAGGPGGAGGGRRAGRRGGRRGGRPAAG